MTFVSTDGGRELEDQDGYDQDKVEPKQEKCDSDDPCHLSLRLSIFVGNIDEWLDFATEPYPQRASLPSLSHAWSPYPSQQTGKHCGDRIQKGEKDDHAHNTEADDVLQPVVLVFAHELLVVKEQKEEHQGGRKQGDGDYLDEECHDD
jgi:hypothetical protein